MTKKINVEELSLEELEELENNIITKKFNKDIKNLSSIELGKIVDSIVGVIECRLLRIDLISFQDEDNIKRYKKKYILLEKF